MTSSPGFKSAQIAATSSAAVPECTSKFFSQASFSLKKACTRFVHLPSPETCPSAKASAMYCTVFGVEVGTLNLIKVFPLSDFTFVSLLYQKRLFLSTIKSANSIKCLGSPRTQGRLKNERQERERTGKETQRKEKTHPTTFHPYSFYLVDYAKVPLWSKQKPRFCKIPEK